SSHTGSADPAFRNVHVCARTEQQAGSNSDKRFHNFSSDRLLFPKSRADRVASVMQLSCRTRGKNAISSTLTSATEGYRSAKRLSGPVEPDHAQPAFGIGLTPIIAVRLGLVAA